MNSKFSIEREKNMLDESGPIPAARQIVLGPILIHRTVHKSIKQSSSLNNMVASVKVNRPYFS